MLARIVALHQEDIQIVAPAIGFLRERQVAGGDFDPHVEAAVLLGWLILNEPFGGRESMAAAVILAGVVITAWPKRE